MAQAGHSTERKFPIYHSCGCRISVMNKDKLSGLLLISLGTFISCYTLLNYSLGNLNNIGPGFFPLILSVLLLILGFLNFLFSNNQKISFKEINFKSLFFIFSGIILFGILLEIIGFIISSFLSILIFSFCSNKFYIFDRILLSLGIIIFVYVIFIFLLGMNVKIYP